MKILVNYYVLSRWNGGLEFASNIVNSIQYQKKAKVILLVPYKPKLNFIYDFVKQILKSFISLDLKILDLGSGLPMGKREIKKRLLGLIEEDTEIHWVKDNGSSVRAEILRIKPDIVLPCFEPLKLKDIPWIGYITDCQHLYYPQLFSEEEVASRNTAFKEMLSQADNILVASNQVKKDCEIIYPQMKCKIHVIPYLPSLQKERFQNLNKIKNQTILKKPYFIVCNQFWRHKDHLTALRAFNKLIKVEKQEINLCLTGSFEDYRDKNYINEIKEFIESNRLSSFVKITGFISKDEQISLLRDAISLIQPSLFEGGSGGGALFDAISCGVHTILSDTDVNLEIRENFKEEITYFKTSDYNSLFECMKILLNDKKSRKKTIDDIQIQNEINKNNKQKFYKELLTTIIDSSNA